MITEVIQVIDTDQKEGAKGPYLEVSYTGKDGKPHKRNIFDQSLWKPFQKGGWVQWQIEKEGDWWNVKGAQSAKEGIEQLPPQSPGELSPEQQAEINRARQGAISKPKEPSRNRSFALAYSKDLAIADRIPVDKILSYAEVFVRWLDGDIQVKDEEVFSSLLKKTFGVT